MKSLFFFMTVVASLAAEARIPWKVGPCADLGIETQDLYSSMREDSRSFYQGKVQMYQLYIGEPACCGAALAIVIPRSSGGKKCIAVTHLNGFNLKGAVADYDPNRGLRVVIPTTDYDPESGGSKTGKLLILRVNLAQSAVRVE